MAILLLVLGHASFPGSWSSYSAAAAGITGQSDLASCPNASRESFDLVERFFAQDDTIDRAHSYSGAFQREQGRARTLGSMLLGEYLVSHRPVLIRCDRAVYATSLVPGSGAGSSQDLFAGDWYVHLVREGADWKIQAVRTLGMSRMWSGFMEMLAANPGMMDSFFRFGRGDEEPEGGPLPSELLPLPSPEEFASMRLMASSDEAIKAHFAAHRAGLDQLANAFTRYHPLQSISSDGLAPVLLGEESLSDALLGRLREIHLTAVVRGEDQVDRECIFAVIGAAPGGEVGYLFAPPACRAPEMSPDHYVLIEPLGSGWHLYKAFR
jgi:hypothetical protein